MPMAIAEAESPFHLPTHGYLAASRVLLLHLNTLAAGNEEVSALTDKVEMQMLANSVSLSVCVYSATPFNSASLVQPQWQLTFQHLPTLATLMLPFLLIIALLLHIVPRSRRAPVPLPA
ncbi:MAG: hypothetical protein DI628_00210 [Blastochloris viridis]|uniref:Uncharacterized protein n=1 Tax=Blastochloris viridis TaxID=1079 RepID=A0A6N4R258_BLAVI|nr:MAG: hypothetical protein DI628_00210 [Blastochloris viridis]